MCDQIPADLLKFTEEFLNGKLHFQCSVNLYILYDFLSKMPTSFYASIHLERLCIFFGA